LPTIGKREVASLAVSRGLPLRLLDLKPDQTRDPLSTFEKTDPIEMLDEPDSPALRAVFASRAAMATYSLDLLEMTDA
jgi:hypothetical protein